MSRNCSPVMAAFAIGASVAAGLGMLLALVAYAYDRVARR